MISESDDASPRLPTSPDDAKDDLLMAKSQRLFPITCQTLIQKIQSDDHGLRETSVARFCTLYYKPIYGFARLRGLSVADAEDRAQDFFVEVIADNLLSKFDPNHGSKLSSWLMKCFTHMELNHRSAASALKRGGGWEFVSFDTDFAEHNYRSVKSVNLSEVSSVDLLLARTFWRLARRRLEDRHSNTSNAEFVKEVLPFVLAERWPDPPALSQGEMARKHRTTAMRLKAFFNRTLKAQAERYFTEEAAASNPGISGQEIEELWLLLRAHAEQ